MAGKTFTESVKAFDVKQVLKYLDKDGNWYRLMKSLHTDIDDGVRRRIFENWSMPAGRTRPICRIPRTCTSCVASASTPRPAGKLKAMRCGKRAVIKAHHEKYVQA